VDRRDNNRRARRVQVQFWKKGESHASTGYTTNISPTGMFIGTNSPAGKGSRLRIEILDPQRGFVVEAEVAHAVKVPPALQQIKPSGMGIKFLQVDELVADLFGGSMVFRPDEEKPPKDNVYGVVFRGVNHFLDTVRRDIQTGGIFVPTKFPAPLNATITVEIHPPDAKGEPVRVPAFVVQRIEPVPPVEGKPLKIAGMGVAFTDPTGALQQLQPMIERFQT
jgi:Tfp pilus assembly protein PilZ